VEGHNGRIEARPELYACRRIHNGLEDHNSFGMNAKKILGVLLKPSLLRPTFRHKDII
jgi:hypothetical protein